MMNRYFSPLSFLVVTSLAACGSAVSDRIASGILGPADGVAEAETVYERLAARNVPTLEIALIQGETAALVRLIEARGGVQTWLSADGGTLSLSDGFLIATSGFGGDMIGSDVWRSRQAILSARTGTVERYHTFIDGTDRTFTRSFRCQITDSGTRDIALGSVLVPVRLYAEDCAGFGTQFQNLYWVDRRSNEIVQSRQWAGDFIGEVAIRQVRR